MNTIVADRVGIVDAHAEEDNAKCKVSTPRRDLRPPSTAGRGLRHAHCVSMSRDDGALGKASLRPLHDRVLVRRMEAENNSPIIVPDVAKTKPLRGVVVAVGPGRKNSEGVFQETVVKPGDIVLFTASVDVPYADLVHEGDLVMMAEADILGILS